MTSRNHSLDVLRGMAVLLVILCHCRISWLEAGWVGVDLFFVLSGFLISGLLFSELRDQGRLSLSRFLIRRGFKIYPAYFFFLGLTAFLFPHLRRFLPMQTLFLQNYLRPANGAHVFDSAYQLWDHTWSLAIEEHFYLGLPILLIVLNYTRSLRWIPRISLGLIFICFALRWHYATLTGSAGGRPMFLTGQRIDALFAGVVLGYVYHFDRQRFMRLSRPLAGFLGVVLLGISIFITEHEYQSSLLTSFTLTLNLSAFSLIVLWAVPRRIPATDWLAEIGGYSYSIYLWHTIVAAFWSAHPVSWWLVIGETVCAVSVGVAMALIVEFPALKLRDKLTPRLRNLKLRDVACGTAET